MIERLLTSHDPAIRRLAGDGTADALASPLVKTLLDFPLDINPYKKWWGTHWRLVALADLGVPPGTGGLSAGIERELAWLLSAAHRKSIEKTVRGLRRFCASMEGNAVYAASKLGFATDPRIGTLVELLLESQWPDGGWNCDVTANGKRSSFHETVTPALGLVAYNEATGNLEALRAARRCAELFLEHELFRSTRTGEPIHPSWTKPHYPAYWHYDILQALRLLDTLDILDDPRATDALELLDATRRPDRRFSGPAWFSDRLPDAVDWGRGPDNEMLNLRAEQVLRRVGGRGKQP